jgi:hypothetical protein
VTDLSDFKRVVYEPEVQALRGKLAAALDREAGTQDALDDALRRVAELESHLGQSEQYRQATQDERDYYRAQRDKQREGREADRRILEGFRDKAERRVTELEAAKQHPLGCEACMAGVRRMVEREGAYLDRSVLCEEGAAVWDALAGDGGGARSVAEHATPDDPHGVFGAPGMMGG